MEEKDNESKFFSQLFKLFLQYIINEFNLLSPLLSRQYSGLIIIPVGKRCCKNVVATSHCNVAKMLHIYRE